MTKSMTARVTQAELEAYLDEALPSELMTAVESEIRSRPDLLHQLKAINHRRNAGVHSVGEIWRRYSLSCASREELGSYLLNVLDPEHAEYIRFHISDVGCPYCAANLSDLHRKDAESSEVKQVRRGKIFQSTAGHLRKVD